MTFFHSRTIFISALNVTIVTLWSFIQQLKNQNWKNIYSSKCLIIQSRNVNVNISTIWNVSFCRLRMLRPKTIFLILGIINEIFEHVDLNRILFQEEQKNRQENLSSGMRLNDIKWPHSLVLETLDELTLT